VYSIDWAQLRSLIAERGGAYRGLRDNTADGAEIFPPSLPHPSPRAVLEQALVVIRRLFRVQGSFARVEGDHLEFLLRTHAYQDFGYSSFRDLVREELQMSQRTATRRVALSRVLRESVQLSMAVEEGRLSPCQALALAPALQSDDVEERIQQAAACTVSELVTLLPEDHSIESDGAGKKVTFGAPASAAYVWDHGIEMARRVLGWEAPVHRCIEAILAETAVELALESSDPEAGHVGMAHGLSCSTQMPASPLGAAHEPPCSMQKPASPEPDSANSNSEPTWTLEMETLHETILIAEDELRVIESFSRRAPEDAELSLDFLRELKNRTGSLRLLLAQMLQDADASGAIAYWGYLSIRDFLVRDLKVSARTGARYMTEAWTFEGNPALSYAYSSGQIGLGQAYLINRVASPGTQAMFIHRAQAVTHLQFEREILFLERMAEYLPRVARRFPEPLPIDMLELVLKEMLKELGMTEVGEEFGAADGDPSANTEVMDRLESLLEAVVLALEEHDLRVRDGVPTLATHEETSTAMLATGTQTTISFWAPEGLIDDWNNALSRVQARHGPLPTWAAAIYVLQIAVREWERVDPSRRPTEWRILERDKWRCQVPGCSARRRLEVHHIVFRSRGGSDRPENLITLCHSHHQHGIHEEGLHLQGAAPGSLIWRLGRDNWFHGSKRIQGESRDMAISEKGGQ